MGAWPGFCADGGRSCQPEHGAGKELKLLPAAPPQQPQACAIADLVGPWMCDVQSAGMPGDLECDFYMYLFKVG